MNDSVIDFLRGGTMIALLGSAIFFWRYWRRTADRLFGFFAIGFFLMALSQVVVLCLGPHADKLPYAYWFRLVAFLFIIFGVIEKNLKGRVL